MFMSFSYQRLIRVFFSMCCLLAATAAMATTKPDTNSHYTLTNVFLKQGKALGVVGGKLVMTDNSSKGNHLLWRMTPIKGRPGYFRITNASLGNGKSLDSSPTTPNIANSGNVSGQFWSLKDAGNGYVRLSNMFQPAKSLDTYGNAPHAPFLAKSGNASGQLWKLTLSSNPKAAGQVKSVSLSFTSSDSLVLTPLIGSDGKPITSVNLSQTTSLSETSSVNSTGQTQFTTNSNPSGSQPALDIVIGGCGGDFPPKSCAYKSSSLAAEGIDRFPEPGIGTFLVAGAWPIMNKLYEQPKVITEHLKNIYDHDKAIQKTNTRDKYVANEWSMICRNPVENVSIKSLMYFALLDAIENPDTKEKKAFVKAFTDYMKERKLFNAELAKHVYERWQLKEMLKARNRLQQTFYIPAPPRDDVWDVVASGAVLGATGGAVLVSIVSVAAYSAVQAAVIAGGGYAAAAATTVGTLTVAGSSSALGAAGTAALVAGPAAIILAGVAISAVAIFNAVEAAEYEKRIETALDDAKKQIDLKKLIRTAEGPGEIAFYWASAMSQQGGFILKTSGNRKAACEQARPNLAQIPREVTGGQLRPILTKLTLINEVSKNKSSFSSFDITKASGTSANPAGLRRTKLGENAWKARSVTYAEGKCMRNPKSIPVSLHTGRVACLPSGGQQSLAKTSIPAVSKIVPHKSPVTLFNCSGKSINVKTFNSNDAAMWVPYGGKATRITNGASAGLKCATRSCKLTIDGTKIKTRALLGYQVYARGAIKQTNADAMKAGCGTYR